ncbi:hypothetical protein HDU92_006197 [Lobulomyces angularis]|nr:hypothetical protein HDU92_006197 [Lobulomyces angularis]
MESQYTAFAYGDTISETLSSAILLYKNYPHLFASIGQPYTSISYEQAAFFSHTVGNPVLTISPYSGGPSLDKKASTPYFFRNVYSNTFEVLGLCSFVSAFWKNVGILYVNIVYPLDAFKECGLSIRAAVSIIEDSDKTDIMNGLQVVKNSKVKIIMLAIMPNQFDIVKQEAMKMGMYGEGTDYVYIGTNNYNIGSGFYGLIYDASVSENTTEANYFGKMWCDLVTVTNKTSPFYDPRNVTNSESQGTSNNTVPNICSPLNASPPLNATHINLNKPDLMSTLAFDSLLALAKGTKRALENGYNATDTKVIAQFMRNYSYEGYYALEAQYNKNQDAISKLNFLQERGDAENSVIGFYDAIHANVTIFGAKSILFGTSPNASEIAPSDGGEANTLNSEVSISLLASVGTIKQATLTIKNVYNDVVVDNKDEISVSLQNTNLEDITNISNVTVSKNENFLGVYNITYTLKTIGNYYFFIKLNGINMQGSPFLIRGYRECVPMCSMNGKCLTDGTCSCDKGYGGVSCSELFPLGSYGIESTFGMTAIVLGGFNVFLTIFSGICVFYFKKNLILRLASVKFTALIIFGLLMWAFYPIFHTLSFSGFVPCWLGTACCHIGFVLVFSTLFFKNFRVLLILNNSSGKKRLNFLIQYYILGVVMFTIGIIGIWQILYPSEMEIVVTVFSRNLECVDKNINFQITLYIFEILILLASAFISLKSRSIQDIYSESKSIAIMTYLMFVLLLISFFMLSVINYYTTRYQVNLIIQAVSVFFGNFILVLWKIYKILQDPERKENSKIKKKPYNNNVTDFKSTHQSFVRFNVEKSDFKFRGRLLGLTQIFKLELSNIAVKIDKKYLVILFINLDEPGHCFAENLQCLNLDYFKKTDIENLQLHENYGAYIFTAPKFSILLEGSLDLLEELEILLRSLTPIEKLARKKKKEVVTVLSDIPYITESNLKDNKDGFRKDMSNSVISNEQAFASSSCETDSPMSK